jgi:hypothetical protein
MVLLFRGVARLRRVGLRAALKSHNMRLRRASLLGIGPEDGKVFPSDMADLSGALRGALLH